VRTDIGLIEVDVVDAVQAVGVAELGIDRFVQIPVEFGAERVQLAAAGLALEIQDEQVLQIVGVGVAAGWQGAAQRPVEQRGLHEVQ
jgi:hypothetical protein